MAAKKRRTQQERAEAWARDVANLDTKGRVYLFAPEAGVTAGPGGSFRLCTDASSKYYEIADARVDDGEAVVMLDAHEGTLRADETRTRPTVVRWRLPPGAWDIVGYHPTARYEASITIAPRDDGRGASAQLWTRAAKGGGR